jgi:hypothetical protein
LIISAAASRHFAAFRCFQRRSRFLVARCRDFFLFAVFIIAAITSLMIFH